MGRAVTEFLEARALAGSRFAASLLLRLAARTDVETFERARRSWRLVVALGAVACGARTAEIRQQALAVVERKWDRAHPSFRAQVIQTWQGVSATSYDRYEPCHNLPPEATTFLRRHVLEYLAGEAKAAGLSMPHRYADFLWGGERGAVAEWLVDALVFSVDQRAVGDLRDLLAGTSQPDLLSAVERAVGRAAANQTYVQRDGDAPEPTRRHVLWRDGRPTTLAEVVSANPHLPLTQPLASGFTIGSTRVLALVLKDRIDPFPALGAAELAPDAVDALLEATEWPASREFVARCRTALRRLPHGAARERLCELAVAGRFREARSAAVDAGYLPADADEVLAFLFSTEQWERYDRLDPTGRRLRGWCEVHAATYHGRRNYRERLEAAAFRAGRPSPCPPLSRASTSTRHGRTGLVGSWPTDPGSGGYDGGSYDGGGGYGGGGYGGGGIGGSF